MPYSFPDNIPRPARSWTEDEQKKCIAAANAVLERGGSEQDAIFACIHAAGKTQHPGGGKRAKEVRKDMIDAKAVWTTAYVNDLPDSCFLYIEPGGEKDEEGKTKPRSLRHFPYKDADGKVDIPHLRNALARIPQSKLPEEVKRRVLAKARRIAKANGIDVGESKSGFKVFRDPQGKLRWLSWTTNSFVDKEGEAFSDKAIDEYVEWANETGNHGELWVCHLPPAVGVCDLAGHFGRFLVETGTFLDTPAGCQAADYFEKYDGEFGELEMSHGYVYEPSDREDGVYDWFVIRERSPLPQGAAANAFTQFAPIIGGDAKMSKISEKLLGLWRKATGTRAEDIIEFSEEMTKALEERGIDAKALSEFLTEAAKEEAEEMSENEAEENGEEAAEEQQEEKAAEETLVIGDAEIKAIAEALKSLLPEIPDVTPVAASVEELGRKVESMNKALDERLKALEAADDEKVAKRIADTGSGVLRQVVYRPREDGEKATKADVDDSKSFLRHFVTGE